MACLAPSFFLLPVNLEGAPVPRARGTFSQTSEPLGILRLVGNGVRSAHSQWLRRTVTTPRAGAVGPGLPCVFPHLVVGPAAVASAMTRPGWMETRVLVERDCVKRMIATEDIAAATAVMAPREECEGSPAGA